MMTGYYRHRNAARQRMGHAIAVWYVSMPQRASLRVFGERVWRWELSLSVCEYDRSAAIFYGRAAIEGCDVTAGCCRWSRRSRSTALSSTGRFARHRKSR
jgi:hypothetical protein